MELSQEESSALAAQIGGIERRTGCEVALAFVGRADRYPEIRWKAFALGVALAALGVVAHDTWRAGWTTPVALLPAVVVILAVGLTNALAAQFAPAYGRLYVRDNRAQAEVRQYAESLFLSRSLFATARRRAVLIVVAAFERTVAVHADTGLAGRIGVHDWSRVLDPITAGLRAGDRADAVRAGLVALETLLGERGFAADGEPRNLLADRPFEEPGP